MPRNAFSHRTADREGEREREGERRSRGMRLRLTRELSLSTENQNDRFSSLQGAFSDWRNSDMVKLPGCSACRGCFVSPVDIQLLSRC